MTKLKVKSLVVKDSPKELIDSVQDRIKNLIDSENYVSVENDPDILFFISGGTERAAINLVSKEKFYLLIGSKYNNAYASATEVKAYLNEMNISSILLDEENDLTKTIINNLLTVKKALSSLNGQNLGLIGQVSEWLISSEISSEVLKNKLGINLNVIPWSELNHFSEFKISPSFKTMFPENSNFDFNKTGQVDSLLLDTIRKKNLDAITVECFSMVQKDKVTACLPLAKLNNDGTPAGCEGDLTAITGMMLCKELTGIIPWMANTNKISNEVCMFSHCTIAPRLVSDFSIKTHFETGIGTAIQGDFKNDVITIFRFNRQLNKVFIATTKIMGRPKSNTACRTQIEVQLSKSEVEILKNNPLGNHHLIVPGDHKEILEFLCEFIGIEILK